MFLKTLAELVLDGNTRMKPSNRLVSLSSLVEYFLAFVYLFFNPNASNAVFTVFQPFLLVCESVFCIQGFGSVRSVRGCGCT